MIFPDANKTSDLHCGLQVETGNGRLGTRKGNSSQVEQCNVSTGAITDRIVTIDRLLEALRIFRVARRSREDVSQGYRVSAGAGKVYCLLTQPALGIVVTALVRY